MKKEAGNFFIIVVGLLILCVGYIYSQGGSPFTLTGQSTTSQGGNSVVGPPTISASFIDKVLCDNASPACGTGQSLYDDGVQSGIDPAYAVAFFEKESTYGKFGVARNSLSLGNLRCIPSARCVDGFAYFNSWQEGYQAWYNLISGPLYVGSGLTTPSAILGRYAPSGDGNDPTEYAQAVEQTVQLLRSGKAAS